MALKVLVLLNVLRGGGNIRQAHPHTLLTHSPSKVKSAKGDVCTTNLSGGAPEKRPVGLKRQEICAGLPQEAATTPRRTDIGFRIPLPRVVRRVLTSVARAYTAALYGLFFKPYPLEKTNWAVMRRKTPRAPRLFFHREYVQRLLFTSTQINQKGIDAADDTTSTTCVLP